MIPSRLLLTISLICSAIALLGQKKQIDSLENKLQSLHEDSSKVKTLNKLVLAYEFQDTTKAWTYCRQNIRLAKSIAYDFGSGEALRLAGILSVDRSDYTNAKLYFRQATKFFEKVKTRQSKKSLGMTRHWMGIIDASEGNYLEALAAYLEAAKIFEEFHDEKSSFYTYQCLMGLEFEEKDYRKGLRYAEDCLNIGKHLNDKVFLIHAHLGMATGNTLLKNFNDVKSHLDTAKVLSEEIDSKRFLGRTYALAGEFFDVQNKNADAIQNFLMAIRFFEQTNDRFQLAGLFQQLGECYLKSGQMNESERCLNKALVLSTQFGLQDVMRVTNKNLSDLKEKQGNYSQSLAYLRDYVKWNDSIQSEDTQKQIRYLEARYQNEKKLKDIAQLQKDKTYQQLSINRKSTFNYVLTGSLLTLLIIGVLFYRNFKSKQQLQIQRIRELEQEKKLISYNALLKGQEEERGRMAKDLHDGLGGMLSGVKLTLGVMQGNAILSEDHTRLFSKALDQLDHSIREMRRVAHNMMPEALVKFGLQQAIHDYCNSLRDGTQLIFNVQLYGLENRLNEDAEITVYRIVQELLNNVIKHANASEVLVQVVCLGQHVNITVEDNGKGFNTEDIKKGAGLSNVRARVNYLKGQLNIKSAVGGGTSVHIECITGDPEVEGRKNS